MIDRWIDHSRSNILKIKEVAKKILFDCFIGSAGCADLAGLVEWASRQTLFKSEGYRYIKRHSVLILFDLRLNLRNLVPVIGDKGRMRHKAFRCMAGVERFHEAIKNKPPLTLHPFLGRGRSKFNGGRGNPLEDSIHDAFLIIQYRPV